MKLAAVLSIIVIVVAIFLTLRAQQAAGKNIVKEPTTMPASSTTQPAGPLDFVIKDIDGNEKHLSEYKGKVVLIVNVASKCGLTPQYTALEKLYESYKDQGLVIVGFPANDFRGQEPGSDAEIKAFCSSKYNVTFPIMSKIAVKGEAKHPLYKFLTEPSTAGDFAGEIEWNFQKFLVDRQGNVFARFAPKTVPSDPSVIAAVEKALSAK